MIPHLSTRLFLVAGFALSLLPCSAQEGGEVTLQFLSFPKALDPQPVELLLGEGKTLEVNIPTNELSKPYKVTRLASWAVGESATGEDGKPAFKVFGQAPALASPKQLILLVRKGATNADGMEVIPIDNRVENFGGGKFLFMNAAKIDIAGEIGGEKFAIEPGKHVVVRPMTGKTENGKKLVHTSLYFRKGEEAKPFFSSVWPLSEKVRSLIFFYHDPETKSLRLHTIRDFLP
jgi:hypothetical protein